MNGARPVLAAARSQLANATLFRALWSPGQLLRGAGVPLRQRLSRTGHAGPPLSVAQYLTFACPESCDFCNVTHAVEDWQKALPVKRQAALVDRLAPRVGTWAIGGGEPLAYHGIIDHIARIRRHGSRVFLVTSTAGINDARLDALCEVEALTVSIHGDRATHDALMGRDGAFDRALGTVAAVAARRRPGNALVVNAVLSPQTAPELRVLAAAAREVGADRLRLTWLSFLTPTERAEEPRPVTAHVTDLPQLSAKEREDMLDEIESVESELGDFLDLQPRLSRAERSAWWQAGGGVHRPCLSLWHTLFLRPDGKVVPCGHLFAEPVGDAATDTLESLWQSAPLRSTRIEQRDAPFPICRRCCKQ